MMLKPVAGMLWLLWPLSLLTLPTAAGARQVPPVSGSPLSDTEYQKFFSRLKPVQEANLFCLMRQAYGCTNPTILRLDRDENHGQIPDGPVCTDVPEVLQFETFCQFAQYRCIKQQFYTKRVSCLNWTLEDSSSAVSNNSSAKEAQKPASLSPADLESLQKNPHTPPDQKPLSTKHPTATPKVPTTSPKVPTHSPNVPTATPKMPTPSPKVPTPSPKVPTHSPKVPTPSQKNRTTVLPTTVLVPAATTASPPKVESPEHESLKNSIWQLINSALSLDASLTTVNSSWNFTKSRLESTSEPEVVPRGSLLALRNDEAVTILCYAVLEGNCLSSMLAMAWKEMEKRIFGFGDSVCDNLGRRHMDLCPDCAFCSLKREQCQNIKTLNRVHCNTGDFSTYINPQISAQHQDAENKSSSSETLEDYNMGLFGGLKSEYWCSRMAIHGCEDPNVTLWLEAEYTVFPDRGTPSEICDSSGVQHPSYCMFKSHQCLQESTHNQRVTRVECNNNETYQVLSAKEGEKEVQLWREKFLSLAKQQPENN